LPTQTARCYMSVAATDCDGALHTLWVKFTIVIVVDIWKRPPNHGLHSKPRGRLQPSTTYSVERERSFESEIRPTLEQIAITQEGLTNRWSEQQTILCTTTRFDRKESSSHVHNEIKEEVWTPLFK